MDTITRTAQKDIFAHEGIDLSARSWFRPAVAPVTASVSTGPSRAVIITVAAVVLAATYGIALLTSTTLAPAVAPTMILPMLVTAAIIAFMPHTKAWMPAHLFALVAGTVWAVNDAYLGNAIPFLVGMVAGAVVTATISVARKITPGGVTYISTDPQDRVFGTPGLVGQSTTLDAKKTARGAEGERKTADLMSALLGIPGVTLFHGLQWPGSANADVDHAVLVGDRLIVLDSKEWNAPGTYAWDGDTLTRTHNGIVENVESLFPDAVAKYQAMYPDLHVEGAYIFHHDNPGTVRTDDANRGNMPHLWTAGEALDALAAFAYNGAGAATSPALINRVAGNIKVA